MKNLKPATRLGTLVLALGLSLSSLAACSSDGGSAGTKELSDDEVLAKIAEANPSAFTDHPSVLDATFSSSSSQEPDAQNFMHFVVEQLPDDGLVHFNAEATITENGQARSKTMEMWGESADKKTYTVYECQGNECRKSSETAENLNKQIAFESLMNIKNLQNLLGKDAFTIKRGDNAYTLTVNVPDNKTKDLLKTTTLNTTAKISDYKIVATYDAKTFYNTSFEVTMNSSINKMNGTVKYQGAIDNNPSDLKIEIPDKAKKAKEIK